MSPRLSPCAGSNIRRQFKVALRLSRLSRQSLALFRSLQVLASGSALVLHGRGSLSKPFARSAKLRLPVLNGRKGLMAGVDPVVQPQPVGNAGR